MFLIVRIFQLFVHAFVYITLGNGECAVISIMLNGKILADF